MQENQNGKHSLKAALCGVATALIGAATVAAGIAAANAPNNQIALGMMMAGLVGFVATLVAINKTLGVIRER